MFHDTIVGLDEYLSYLRSLGYDARGATSEERARLGQGALKRDNHCITVAGRPFEMISLRTEGWVGPLDSIRHRSGTVRIAGIPVKHRTVLPLKTHYVLFCEPRQACAELAAELHLRKEGILKRRVVGGYWEGGRLAAVLNMDRPTIQALVEHIGPDETLLIKPDHAASCVRLVHRSVRVFDYNLFKEGLVGFEQELAAPELLAALERIATHTRDYIAERLQPEG
jgi:hypothetical protein